MAAYKENIEFDVPDVFMVINRLRNYPGILSVNIITSTRLSVWYDNRKIQGKLIIKRAVPKNQRGKAKPKNDQNKAA